MPRVACLLVNYRGALDVIEAARSALADAPGLPVVVVDNSECPQEVAALRQALPPGVLLLVAPHNLGFGAACNWAASQVSAEFYWLVNPDVRVRPGCLEQLLKAMDADATLGAVAPRQYLDEAGEWLFSPSWLPTALGTWARERVERWGHGSRQRVRHGRAVRAENLRAWAGHGELVVPQRALSGAAVLVRRACFHPVHGLFDPAYFMYFEDSDMCLRLRRTGWRMALSPQAEVVHLWRMGGHKQGLMAEAAPVYYAKNFPGSPWLARAERMACLPVQRLADDVPRWLAGKQWDVPVAWQGGWSLELSPLPLFLPCVGRLGVGASVAWPTAVVEAMEGTAVFARLGPLDTRLGPPQVFSLGQAMGGQEG